MVRILAASDTHGDSELVKKLALKAKKENVDLIILCGDLTGFDESAEIIKPFKQIEKQILIIPGNHETSSTTEALAKQYDAIHLHGKAHVHEDIAIFGAGGSTDFTAFLENQTEEELFEKLKTSHDKIKHLKKKIMITHMHPYGEQSKLLDISASESITKAIELFRPTFLLHGHIHETAGMEERIGSTQVINVGRDGKIIEL
jgi:putative phosphoesterase